MKLEALFRDWSQKVGVTLSDEQLFQFLAYLELIRYWNRKINLTSVTEDRDIIRDHFVDSLAIAHLVRVPSRLLDIGSGAGFPGLPLKIAAPELDVTLLEATRKRVFFLKEVIRKLGLKGIKAVWGRAGEDIPDVPLSWYDYATARGVGSVSEIVGVGCRYLAPGGRFILMRGRMGEEEWVKAEEKLKGIVRLVGSERLVLPSSNKERVNLVLEKI
ncbi:MAG: 16S rRNA (guanine(527)-N(7))-methyltransferase RsmG [Candidatus Methanosuratincola sp.]